MAKRDKSTRKEPQHNVACTNFLKVGASRGCGGLQAEMEERLGSNTANIDKDRTKLNLYFLPDPEDRQNFVVQKEKPEASLEDRVYARINEVGATVKQDKRESVEPGRKKNPRDSIIMENIIFQVSHERAMEILREDDMLDEKGKIRTDREFSMESKTMKMFLDTYRFAMDRYGAENVVGAYLHFDEYTPHMHLQVVPLEKRPVMFKGQVCLNKDGTPKMKWRLNNKELFGREEYKGIWPAYAEALKDYGVVAAEGLVPKGEYEKQASMEAVNQQVAVKEEKVKQLDNQVSGLKWEQEQKEREKDQLEKKNQELVKKLAEMEARLAKAEKDVNAAVDENQSLQNSISYSRDIVLDILTNGFFEQLPAFVHVMIKNSLQHDAPFPILEAFPVPKGPYRGNFIISMDVEGTVRNFWVNTKTGEMYSFKGNLKGDFDKGFSQEIIYDRNTRKPYIFSRFVKFMNRVPKETSKQAFAAIVSKHIIEGSPSPAKAPARQSHGGGGSQPKPQPKEKPVTFGKGGGINTPGGSSSSNKGKDTEDFKQTPQIKV